TKVVGKLDLASIEENKPRKRKRKRKKKAASTDGGKVNIKDSSGSKTSKRKRKRKPRVDEEDVEQTLQDTLRELEQGAARVRQRRRRNQRQRREEERERERQLKEEQAGILRVTEFVSTGELANLMGVPVNEVISTLFGAGMMVSINQRLDADTIQFVADEFGLEVEFITEFGTDDIELEEDDPEDLIPRAPVVTVMGHVDHGKTSLLDYIRKANVVAGESGGITQHIGAYQVELPNERSVTFLDTPGHEAFTAMRARGAKVTDVVILVVAANDAVMPQTQEAINHARAAEVPIVVAINKIDLPEANTQKVMQQLAEENVLVEQYGGNVQCALVSAMNGEGVDDLLEKVLLEADLQELQGNPEREANGIVIEARLDKGRGNVATVLVQNGTLHVGDPFVAGIHSGRVRAMFDERDNRIMEVGPSQPALVLGFNGSPNVGDQFVSIDDESEAKDIAQRRAQIHREQKMRQRKHIRLEDIGRRMALGEFSELNLIIKGDVGGSVEALADSLLKLSTDEVAVAIIHSGVGAISESDVMLASASDAVILGFQVRPTAGARAAAEREEIDIHTYSIIYNAIENIRDALEGMLTPEESEKINGVAEVRDLFKVPKAGTIAGCMVTEGRIHRNDRVHLVREGVVVYDGKIASLRRFKDDAREVQSGYECGIGIENFNDLKVGDQIEAYEIVETKRKLEV
ncbi:MAG TPA: translation initiation factor IF-2, partial [Rhodothermales bacterium]|nr:translation initiation factor IF-2 [Rhodothermales bacterium]